MGFGLRIKERMRKAKDSIFNPDSIIMRDKLYEYSVNNDSFYVSFDASLLLHQKEEGNVRIKYEITESDRGNGFFAEFNMVLARLVFADRFGFIPEVSWGKDFAYNDNDQENMFDVFFQPIIAEGCSGILKGNYLSLINRIYGEDHYYIPPDFKRDMSKAFAKYIHIQPALKQEFDLEYDRIVGKNNKVLGVHYRGTDFKRNYRNHPVIVSIDEMISSIEKLKEDYDCIFVATDDETFKNMVVKDFGNKIRMYEDVKRSSGNKSVVFERGHSKYLLAREVLRDAYSLSRCDSFLCGRSSVGSAVEIAKMAKNEVFKEYICIDKGINNEERPVYSESQYFKHSI